MIAYIQNLVQPVFNNILRNFGNTQGQCHNIAIQSVSIGQTLNIPLSIQSGIVQLKTDTDKFTLTHSWNILKNGDDEYIVDFGLHNQKNFNFLAQHALVFPIINTQLINNHTFLVIKIGGPSDLLTYKW